MDITAVNRPTNVPVAAPSGLPPEKAAENRAIVQAVKAMNGTEMFGKDNQLTFSRDPNSQRMVVQVINRNTNEVVSQIPPEYLLQMADDLKKQQENSPTSKLG